MMSLQITDLSQPTAPPLVSVQIADVDPTEATVAVLNALKGLKTPRKTRSDAGKSRIETANRPGN